MSEARFQTDFYRCPNTGEWVYRWKDERTVVIDSADLRALREALTAAQTERDELVAAAHNALDTLEAGFPASGWRVIRKALATSSVSVSSAAAASDGERQR